MIARQATNGLQCFTSLGRQVESVASPVFGIRTPVDHAALFQLVDQDDQPARQDSQVTCRLLWLIPPAPPTNRRIPACGGVRSTALSRSVNFEAACAPSWARRNAGESTPRGGVGSVLRGAAGLTLTK